MNSCLYESQISHSRVQPKRYQFKRASFLFCLDLDELDAFSKVSRLLSCDRKTLYQFKAEDYLPGIKGKLIDRVRSIASENGIQTDIVSVTMLTNVRTMGYIFNPLTLYFCFGVHRQPLCAVAEVGNTFGERKPFFVPATSASTFESSQKKLFYISPFSQLDQEIDFFVQMRADNLLVSIKTKEKKKTVVSASINGQKLPLNDKTLWMLTLRYPLSTIATITLIHWHALVLWLGKFPFFEKRSNPHLQVGLINAQPPKIRGK
jgi:DUF1365 family protein